MEAEEISFIERSRSDSIAVAKARKVNDPVLQVGGLGVGLIIRPHKAEYPEN